MNDLVIVIPLEIKEKSVRLRIRKYLNLGYRVEPHDVKDVTCMSLEKYERLHERVYGRPKNEQIKKGWNNEI